MRTKCRNQSRTFNRSRGVLFERDVIFSEGSQVAKNRSITVQQDRPPLTIDAWTGSTLLCGEGQTSAFAGSPGASAG